MGGLHKWVKSPVLPLALTPDPGHAPRMDPDYLAFRGLLKQAESDQVLAAQIERPMREGAPRVEVLALRPKRH